MKSRSALRFLPLFVFFLFGTTALEAQPFSVEPRVEAAKCVSPEGALVTRSRPGKPWHFAGTSEEVYSRDLLVCLPGLQADLLPRAETVLLSLRGNHPSLSSFSGLDTAVVLHDSRSYDLDFTLFHGRVVITNKKAKEPLQVWLRLPEQAWQLTFTEPGSEVAIEEFGRWPRGVAFTRTPKETDVPTRAVSLVVLKGAVTLKTDTREFSLSAPPGPAAYRWDSVAGGVATPQRIEGLPDWLTAPPSADGKMLKSVIDNFLNRKKQRNPVSALTAELVSAPSESNPRLSRLKSEFAIDSLAALDELDPVVEALSNDKHAATRRAAVLALRQWIGEAAGRDLALYQLLTESGYSRGQAETILQMLHSPFDAVRPETYDTLIAYLNHNKLGVRELAAFQLYRLVPSGADIPYDAAAPDEERLKSIAKWRKLIPEGKLPQTDQ